LLPYLHLIGIPFAAVGLIFVAVGAVVDGDDKWNQTGRPIFVVLGAIFAIAGITAVVFWLRARMKTQRLRRTGELVYAELTSSRVDRSVMVNGRHPWIITCEWTDPETNFIHTFTATSETKINRDGDAPVEFPVYIDPGDPSNYLLDLTARRELR
jgi:hypothetical protein